jgi:hypothetical protein
MALSCSTALTDRWVEPDFWEMEFRGRPVARLADCATCS